MESDKHRSLVDHIAKNLARRGFLVIKDGERAKVKAKKFKGLCRVDIIAIKNDDLLLIECGWIDGWRRLERIRENVSELSLDQKYHVKILWYPYLYSLAPHNWKY